VCTRTVRTGLEKINQHEIITILGDRVGDGKVPMSAIDVAWLVFGPVNSSAFLCTRDAGIVVGVNMGQ